MLEFALEFKTVYLKSNSLKMVGSITLSKRGLPDFIKTVKQLNIQQFPRGFI